MNPMRSFLARALLSSAQALPLLAVFAVIGLIWSGRPDDDHGARPFGGEHSRTCRSCRPEYRHHPTDVVATRPEPDPARSRPAIEPDPGVAIASQGQPLPTPIPDSGP